MKYLIVGTGAVGATIGAFLLNAGKDVDFISRGKQLERLISKGLEINSDMIGEKTFKDIKAYSQNDFAGKVDIIFVCVKSYSIEEIAPLIEKVSNEKTLVIPILNTFETGKKLAQTVKTPIMLDGCIYVVSEIENSGEIKQTTNIFRIVFGRIDEKTPQENILNTLTKDLNEAKIESEFVDDINSAKFAKFSLTSAFACCGAYYDIEAKDFHKQGKYRTTLIEMLNEMKNLSKAMNLNIKSDIVSESLAIIDKFNPTATASMQRDLKLKGQNQSEMSGLLFDVIKLGQQYNVKMPRYEEIAHKFSNKKNIINV